MNGDLSHIVTQETKSVLSTYQGMGKIHAVLIGMTSLPSMAGLFPDWYPVHIMPTGDSYNWTQLKQIIYN